MNNNLKLTVTKDKDSVLVSVENIPLTNFSSVLTDAITKSLELYSRGNDTRNVRPDKLPTKKNPFEVPEKYVLRKPYPTLRLEKGVPEMNIELENGEYDKYLANGAMSSQYSEKLHEYANKSRIEDRSNTSLVACNCVGCGDTIIKRLPNEGDQIVHCNKCGEDTKINSTVRGKIQCPSCGFENRLSRVEAGDNEDILLKCGKCKTEVVGKYHETNHMYVLNN